MRICALASPVRTLSLLHLKTPSSWIFDQESEERRDGVSPRRVPPCGWTVVCQVFSWQSFKSAQLEKASSNTSILATMENVIRLGFEIVHPDKRLTIWHFLHLLDHFLRQVRELPWNDVPFLSLRYGIALVADNGKLVPTNLTENQIYLSGMYNVSLVSASFGNDVNEAFGTTAFQTLANSDTDAASIRRKVDEIRRRPGALNLSLIHI